MSGSQDTAVRTHRAEPRGDRILAWPGLALVAVGVVYAVVQIVVVGVHFGYTHDETVYLSQLDPKVPDFGWNAWRAWGTAVVMAPASLLSAGLAATRLWATALTSVGLIAAFWPWLKVVRPIGAVPLGALLFATSWLAAYFGNDVQPNIYIALGAVAAVGFFLRATYGDKADRRIRYLVGLGGALFFVALVRPSDALLIGAPLGLACLIVPSTRRWVAAIPITLGVLFGWLPWIIESFQDFGGPVNRYHLSQAHDAVGGFHLNLHTATLYARILNGPFYAGGQYPDPGGYSSVWLAAMAFAAVCVAVGVFASWRAGRLTPVALSVAVTAMLSLLYVFLLGYAAVRFLLPMGALLAIPIALGLVALAQRRRRATTAVAVAVVVALVGADLGLQFQTLHHNVVHDGRTRSMFRETGLALRGLVQPKCAVIGSIDPAPVAYWGHCLGGAQTVGTFGPAFVRQAKRYQRRGMRVAVVTYRLDLPPYFANWKRTELSGAHDHDVLVVVSPPTRR